MIPSPDFPPEYSEIFLAEERDMSEDQLTFSVAEFMKAGGVDLFAVVPVELVAGAEPGYRPQDLMPEVRAVITYAVRMFRFPRIEALDSEGKPRGMTEYTANFFIAANLLDQLAYRTACLINEAGYHAFPISSGPPYDGRKLRGLISHKYMMEAAGLTQRGLNQLTLSERFGPRIRLGSILTSAPLSQRIFDPPKLCIPQHCDHACVQACPVKALSRENKIDLQACDRFNEIVITTGPLKTRCGRCIQACPVGN